MFIFVRLLELFIYRYYVRQPCKRMSFNWKSCEDYQTSKDSCKEAWNIKIFRKVYWIKNNNKYCNWIVNKISEVGLRLQILALTRTVGIDLDLELKEGREEVELSRFSPQHSFLGHCRLIVLASLLGQQDRMDVRQDASWNWISFKEWLNN